MNKRIKISWDTIWLIPLLIFAVNFILKLIYLDRRDIANDEPFTIFWAQAGLKDIFRMLPTENNPPFHFFLMHFWIKLFGISALSVRFPSLLFSSFTAVIIFLIGKRFYSIFTGISAALIFTFSTMQVYFSHEARVYPLFALLTAISLYIFLIIREKPERKQLYVFLFLTNFILIYSHYFGFFVLLIELISTLITKQRRQLIMPMFVLMSGLALSYLPVIYPPASGVPAFGVGFRAARASPNSVRIQPRPNSRRTRLVLVDATVRDKKGKIVNDLAVTDFQLSEDGKARPISSFALENLDSSEPQYVLFLFDNAWQKPPRQSVADIAGAYAAPNRYMAIANFSGALSIAQNFTSLADRVQRGRSILRPLPRATPAPAFPMSERCRLPAVAWAGSAAGKLAAQWSQAWRNTRCRFWTRCATLPTAWRR